MVRKQLRHAKLHTICEEAKCPNIGECFNRGTATFLILGRICSRNCTYCHVQHGIPEPLNTDEPDDVAESVRSLGLRYAVITSVTRDDLSDGGAEHFAQTIQAIKKQNPHCKVEVLIPDFQGNTDSLKRVLSAKPDVLNHNIEVVEELFSMIRPQGDYQQSLTVLKMSKTLAPDIPTKSGFMVGLGETTTQIHRLLKDLRSAHVEYLTIGQYLQPSKEHRPVSKYYSPEEFVELESHAYTLGFSHVVSGPLVRSSYHADECIRNK